MLFYMHITVYISCFIWIQNYYVYRMCYLDTVLFCISHVLFCLHYYCWIITWYRRQTSVSSVCVADASTVDVEATVQSPHVNVLALLVLLIYIILLLGKWYDEPWVIIYTKSIVFTRNVDGNVKVREKDRCMLLEHGIFSGQMRRFFT